MRKNDVVDFIYLSRGHFLFTDMLHYVVLCPPFFSGTLVSSSPGWENGAHGRSFVVSLNYYNHDV